VSIKKMLLGDISVKNLSGPITIAQVAGDSVERGLETFLNFLAYLSISLGVINILPIPMLDGGHLMYYLAELVRGKPVSEKAQMLGLRIGIGIIMTLMFFALYNDLMRLL
jgi:regulator of sigma E protease